MANQCRTNTIPFPSPTQALDRREWNDAELEDEQPNANDVCSYS